MQKDCLNLIFPYIESDDFDLFIQNCTFKDVCFMIENDI